MSAYSLLMVSQRFLFIDCQFWLHQAHVPTLFNYLQKPIVFLCHLLQIKIHDKRRNLRNMQMTKKKNVCFYLRWGRSILFDIFCSLYSNVASNYFFFFLLTWVSLAFIQNKNPNRHPLPRRKNEKKKNKKEKIS